MITKHDKRMTLSCYDEYIINWRNKAVGEYYSSGAHILRNVYVSLTLFAATQYKYSKL
jgi:hypothetical protein